MILLSTPPEPNNCKGNRPQSKLTIPITGWELRKFTRFSRHGWTNLHRQVGAGGTRNWSSKGRDVPFSQTPGQTDRWFVLCHKFHQHVCILPRAVSSILVKIVSRCLGGGGCWRTLYLWWMDVPRRKKVEPFSQRIFFPPSFSTLRLDFKTSTSETGRIAIIVNNTEWACITRVVLFQAFCLQ